MNVARTVLVVEDNLQICEYLTEVLKGAEYNVVCAQNGEEAVEALDREQVDLAIVDLLLPGGISGDDIAARAVESRVKVITMSGSLSSDTHGRDLRHPHLQKPFRGPALLAEIEKVFGNS
jgi:two-component system response regulator CpxR